MNITHTKKDVKKFLASFGIKLSSEPSFGVEDMKGYFNQYLNTKEQYVDTIYDYLDCLDDLEMIIKYLKDERTGIFSPIMQREYEHIKMYATNLYRFRRVMKQWRREYCEASYENSGEHLVA